MNCYKCVCNQCANSVELSLVLFTPGESQNPCFACDECHRYDGDFLHKPDQKRESCRMYQAPAKLAEIQERVEKERARRADRQAQQQRQNFKVIKGGKNERRTAEEGP